MTEKRLIIFTDSGDTIIDEGSEIRKVPGGVVYSADCIPGAKETMLTLYEEGYTIALVADGLDESFQNVMKQNGLDHIYKARAISELSKAEKPDRKMFDEAMKQLGLTDQDKDRIIMVGNNIKRDVVGANRFGITSVLLKWSPRYPMTPENEEEVPDYTIETPSELISLVEKLNYDVSH